MPVVFIFILFRFPAGLMVYWVTTNLWTIMQQSIIRRSIGKRELQPLGPKPPGRFMRALTQAQGRGRRATSGRDRTDGAGSGTAKSGARRPARQGRRQGLGARSADKPGAKGSTAAPGRQARRRELGAEAPRGTAGGQGRHAGRQASAVDRVERAMDQSVSPPPDEQADDTDFATVASAATVEAAKKKALEQLRKVVPYVREDDVEFVVVDEGGQGGFLGMGRSQPRVEARVLPGAAARRPTWSTPTRPSRSSTSSSPG